MAHLKECEHLLGFKDNIVLDCNSAGIALASTLLKIAYVSVKIVERNIDDPKNINTYLGSLKQYTNLGKAVVTCIGDIGRNDVLTSERGI